ncbi:MAG: hypothetical protein ABIP36_07435 [Acidimicrobiales bacterium]
MYRRPLVAAAPASLPHATTPSSPDVEVEALRAVSDLRPKRTPPDVHLPSGAAGGFLIAIMVVGVVIGTRGLGQDHLGVVVFPAAGIVAAVSFGRRCRRLRPDEPWLPRLILFGTIVKIGACAARYISLTRVYNNIGDAFIYDREGRELVEFWTGQRSVSPAEGLALRSSGLVRWLTGVVYYLFGQDLLAAFFLFGLLAVMGSYFWYRALVDAVPYVDRRLFLLFVLFVPSIVFWPGSLGKEALMQVALGAMAWATSLVFRSRFAQAAPLALCGGGLLYLIRPHLLALATVAAAVPYFVGRVRGDGVRWFQARPVGMLILGLLVVFTVTVGTKYVGLESLSISSVEEQLDEQTAATSEGGSKFAHRGNSITSPLFLPMGFVTVLLRPFPWEVTSAFQLFAALESSALIWLLFRRSASVRLAVRRCRQEPFLLYCIMLLVFYSATFSSLANFGLLTRQRSLVLPAIYALIALAPALVSLRSHDGAAVEVVGSARRDQ